MIASLTTASLAAELGLAPEAGFWLAISLFVVAALLDLLLFYSITSRREQGLKPNFPLLIGLSLLSTLVLMAALLLLLL
jgi:hypothetical protein